MTLKLGQIVTLEMLKAKKGACPYQLEMFNREWPLGCELNITNLERAAALQLNFHWFAMSFLPYPLWKEYDQKEDLLLKEYDQKTDLLWKECNQKEYNQEIGLLWKEYCQKVALLLLNILRGKVTR